MMSDGNVKQFDPRREQERLSLEDIWRLGCLGDRLSSNDHAHFVKLARNRFYTFQMGIQHEASGERPDHRIELLIRGLATELLEGPGLERQWHDSEFSNGRIGKRVSRLLRRRRRKAAIKRWLPIG